MDEKQLIKQFKTLKSIKPNKQWASLCKEQVFTDEPAQSPQGIISNVFAVFERHAVVFSMAGFVGLVLIGGLFYFNSQKANSEYERLEGLLADVASQSENSQGMLVSLGELQGKLEGVKMAMDNLKNAKDPNQALAMTEIVRTTANEGRDVVKRIKKSNGDLSEQVLASLVQVEVLSDELDFKGSTMQKEIFENYIEDLKQRSLSAEDKELLEKAEGLYGKGKEAEAMLLITRIGLHF